MRLPVPMRLAELAEIAGADVSGDAGFEVGGIASLERAEADELSFVRSAKWKEAAAASGAGALLVSKDFAEESGELDRPVLVAQNADAALVRLDRTCQEIMRKTRGRVQITLLSDHGHNLMKSQRLPLTDELVRCGYRVCTSLRNAGDVVVPEFGAVNCAAIYTLSPATVARDVAGIEGVDLVTYRDDANDVIVLSRTGRARISRDGERYRYVFERGDPLQLRPVLEALAEQGKVDGHGYVDDETLFAATVDGAYPDGVHRLWRAFDGLVENTPDVLISVKDGWHCGSPTLSNMLEMRAIHGSLSSLSSSAFVMTTLAPLRPQ